MPTPTSTRRRRPLVLFVEDNQQQLDLYELVVERDFTVIRSTRGNEGFQVACEEMPDAIVMDVKLPDADGLDVCRRLHAHPQTAKVPVLVLTGDDDAYARAHLLHSELTGVLMKPCPADRLLSALHQAVERARTTKP